MARLKDRVKVLKCTIEKNENIQSSALSNAEKYSQQVKSKSIKKENMCPVCIFTAPFMLSYMLKPSISDGFLWTLCQV